MKICVVGWYFEVTLRQSFNYKKYPLDHKTVWIRMWPRNFLKRTLLFPDFAAYSSTELEDAFGFDTDIVLGNWEIEETLTSNPDVSYQGAQFYVTTDATGEFAKNYRWELVETWEYHSDYMTWIYYNGEIHVPFSD